MPRRDVNPTAEIAKALAKLGKASFGDILKEADISRQALDIHLKRMLDKKLILSEQDPKDKRKYLYWLNPNELAVITVDEVIEAIKDELKAVGEELNPKEEQNIRDWLITHFRNILIEELKADLPLHRWDIKEHIFSWITSIILGKKLIPKILLEKKVKDFETLVKKMTPLKVAHVTVKAISDFPENFIEKWIKTNAFKQNPGVITLQLIETGRYPNTS